MMNNIYIDDKRIPINPNFKLVKDYFQFISLINELYPFEFYNDTQMEDLFISFDHDLSCFLGENEYTGMNCAIYLFEKGIIPKGICVHSDNVCADRIQSYLFNYAKMYNKKIEIFNKLPFRV